MYIFFVDESIQERPSRVRMGPMIAVGGFAISFDLISPLEDKLHQLCKKYGFPKGECFKWSPGKEHWMRKNLIGKSRQDFQIEVLGLLKEYECQVIFIAEDKNHSPAGKEMISHELDVAKLFIERANWFLKNQNRLGMIVIDRRGGDHKKDEKYLSECLEIIENGTEFVKTENIIMTALSAPSRLTRLLQAADLIAGCLLSHICGEDEYSKPVFKQIVPLIHRENSQVGGFGIKLHPDFIYLNFYHWFFKDEHYSSQRKSFSLPTSGRPFCKSVNEY